MANLQNFVFFDGPSPAGESNILALNPNAGAIILHVESKTDESPGTINFQLKASSDLEVSRQGVDNYITISGVNLGTFETERNITSIGIYMFVLPAATRVKAVSVADIGEDLKVFGTVIE